MFDVAAFEVPLIILDYVYYKNVHAFYTDDGHVVPKESKVLTVSYCA